MRSFFAKHWKNLSDGTPGHRFQDRYRAQRRASPRGGLVRRLVHLFLALVAIAIGVVLAFIPGPAILFFFIAGALLASDWLWLARTLDWLEVKLHALWKRVTRNGISCPWPPASPWSPSAAAFPSRPPTAPIG